MINTKISFHNMDHSAALEAHSTTRLKKIDELMKNANALKPLHIEVWLKANKQHPHHAVEIHLKTPIFDLNAHDEGTDMYASIDNAVDKVVKLLKKEKDKLREKTQKAVTEKSKFVDDKY